MSLRNLLDIAVIFFITIGILSFLLKLFNLIFKPRFLSTIKFINDPPSKIELGIYYFASIILLIYGIVYKLERLMNS